MIAALIEGGERLGATPPGLARHAAIVGALIEAGGLAQGLADAAFEAGGCDGLDPVSGLALDATGAFADAAVRSWTGGFRCGVGTPPALRALLEQPLPDRVTVSTCEGYAFYGVYPELYLEAARSAFERPPRVIGVRSIGTSLAAVVSAAAGASGPISVRPVGDPFDRELRLSEGLRAAMLAPAEGGYAVVDEGPGLSGSSFDAVGRTLTSGGVDPAAVIYMPSHGGEPGAAAPPERRERWRAARRVHAPFEAVIEPRLKDWAEPLTGKVRSIESLSGGAWRSGRTDAAGAWPEQERRKFRVRAERGDFLLKFAGLGIEGQTKLERARRLAEAGFTPEPLGLAHGFLVERWAPGQPLDPGAASAPAMVPRLAAYLGFRARLPVEGLDGADPGALRAMIRRNLGAVGLQDVGERACAVPFTAADVRPMAIDGRLHLWEWVQAGDGRLIKTDALDHCQAHDLIGAQDLAWDVAGAGVEFGLSPAALERLRLGVEQAAGRRVEPRLVSVMTAAYLAFQIGYWRMAAEGAEGARALHRAHRYERTCACWTPM